MELLQVQDNVEESVSWGINHTSNCTGAPTNKGKRSRNQDFWGKARGAGNNGGGAWRGVRARRGRH